jgi:hypothetical protein
MKNAATLKPKFVQRGGRWRTSGEKRQVGAGSRLITEAVARAYGRQLPGHARGRLLDLGCSQVPLYGALGRTGPGARAAEVWARHIPLDYFLVAERPA